jgi:DNA-nicking Smr family endonuclease
MHRPFEVLESFIRDGRITFKKELAVPATPEPAVIDMPTGLADDELFAHAMKDVTALGWSATPLHPRPPIAIAPQDNEALALVALADFIRRGDVDVETSAEYIEGASRPEGRLYLDDLRAGRFAVQACLDLHGLNRVEARFALDEFIIEAVRLGLCCIRVVHGRGRHSPKSDPVLKESVQRWLLTRRLSRHVAAFTSARRCDGGSGAVYVLLI